MSPVFAREKGYVFLNVKMSGNDAMEWSDLDVDLEIDSLKHPERYPLIMKRNQLDYIG